MIHVEERDFQPAELSGLESERAEVLRSRRRFRRFTFGSLVVVLALGVPLALGQMENDRGLGLLAFGTVAVYAGIVLYVFVRENLESRARLERLARLGAGGGRVRVTHCRSERVAALEEMEDEGPEYVFQVGPGECYYVGGQHFELGPSFPNTDFEILEGRDDAGRPIYFEVRCHGDPLLPERIIRTSTKLRMLASDRYPRDGDRLACDLDDVETFVLG